MDEYREIIDVNPVLLYTEDLRELERVIKVDFACEGDDFEVIAEIGPKRMSASSVNALVAQNPTGDINSLTIRARSRRHTPEIDAGVSLTFHRKFADYQLHADSETLFYGKRGQLNAFLQSRRPWYGKALAFFPFVLPNFTLLSLVGALVFAVRQDWLLPAKTRNDLRNELKKSPDFQDRGQKWFNDICNDIKLSMKAPGAPHKFVKPASSLR